MKFDMELLMMDECSRIVCHPDAIDSTVSRSHELAKKYNKVCGIGDTANCYQSVLIPSGQAIIMPDFSEYFMYLVKNGASRVQ